MAWIHSFPGPIFRLTVGVQVAVLEQLEGMNELLKDKCGKVLI